MKQIYTLTALIFLSLFAAAQSRPVDEFTAWWGDWSKASNWSLNRVPENGDSVVIPNGKGVVFDKQDDYTNLYIEVEGTLTIKKQLTLDNASVINIANYGGLNAWNANRKKEIIILGGVTKYGENDNYWIWGPATASASTSSTPFGFSNVGTLPVTFVSFYAVRNNEDVQLTWSTAQEMNNDHFEVERSTDGTNWTVIAIVMGSGTSTSVAQYAYTDKNITASVVYYRIRQVDTNGAGQYTQIKTVKYTGSENTANIYASGSQTISVDFNKEVANTVMVQVVNLNGQVIAQQSYQQPSYRVNLTLSHVATGAYVVRVTDNSGWFQVKKVIL